ncbi:MAG: Ku protein [Alphaproteobacteria bacterium]|nr:Ku protein [Alphaproteobacteria bacterium]MBM3641561.1 Ku protein [Alphaproteobacteria bacterium]
MAPRSFWKGYLKLSLVTCPVAMTPATTEGEKVRFHILNRNTGNRVVSQYVDSVTGAPIGEDDAVKGYPRSEDDYVLLEDEELDTLSLESTRTIDVDTFAPAASIDWIWFDKPHYLIPDDPIGVEAFSVIRDAMKATGTVGLSRLVMYRRERAVMIEPRDKGLILWTLRFADEVRDPNDYLDKIRAETPNAKAFGLISKLIEKRKSHWDPSMTQDSVQAQLLDIISGKKKERTSARGKKQAPATPSNVVNIMDALRKSIDAEKRSSKRR